MQFDEKSDAAENHFIRNSESMLSGIFGTTEVTPFWVADMDFKVAEPILNELQRLVDRGKFAYEFNSKDVFNAISKWNKRRHDLNLYPDNFVQVTGVLTGIALAIRALTEEGDGVLIQTPAYHQFNKVISTAKRRVVKSALSLVDGKYEMDLQDLEQKMGEPSTKVLLLCNPHNPVGRVWRQEELVKVIKLASKYGVTIISDEIHSDIVYQGHRFSSLMSLEPQKYISVIGSPSKTFGMQSISNGYLYTEDKTLLEKLKSLAESLYLDHGNAFTTFATITAFEHGEEWFDEFLVYMQGTVSWINDFVGEALPNVRVFPVEGTYQAWLDFTDTGLSGDELIKLFGKAGFGASPGTWFDSEAKQYARISFACPRVDIQEAFQRLEKVLAFNTSSIVGNEPTLMDKK